ncbi:MAG: triose-phosphate isomerase [Gemmatimonadota bacterium]
MSKVVAGNWKMNHGLAATRAYLESFQGAEEVSGVTVILFPPAISLTTARAALGNNTRVRFGIQHIHGASSGAFTGELSAEMAAEAGARYALIGHSERRHLFHETEAETAIQVEATRRVGMTPVLCVGETVEERRAGKLEKVLARQLKGGIGNPAELERITAGDALILAYEPVWAIGTGETASPGDASEAQGFLRERLGELVGAERGRRVPILYGGSVNPGNALELLSAQDVDGVLVGGASLEPDSFLSIVRAGAES